MCEGSHIFALNSVVVIVWYFVNSSIQAKSACILKGIILHLDDKLLVLVDICCRDCEYCWLPEWEVDVVLDSNSEWINILQSSQYTHPVSKENLNTEVNSHVLCLTLFYIRQRQGAGINRRVGAYIGVILPVRILEIFVNTFVVDWSEYLYGVWLTRLHGDEE